MAEKWMSIIRDKRDETIWLIMLMEPRGLGYHKMEGKNCYLIHKMSKIDNRDQRNFRRYFIVHVTHTKSLTTLHKNRKFEVGQMAQ